MRGDSNLSDSQFMKAQSSYQKKALEYYDPKQLEKIRFKVKEKTSLLTKIIKLFKK